MFPIQWWEALMDSAWGTLLVLAIAPVLVLAVFGLSYLMARMGWRKVEARTVECPETGRSEKILVDFSHEPEGVTDVAACSRFHNQAVSCGKECLVHRQAA